MKQWLKNFALAGAAVSSAVLGAASASAVSFTVVIDKIEVMENGNSTDRFVIYNPVAGIGGTATTTLDLLNANKSGASLPIVAPRGGTYRTMLVTFGSVQVAAETDTVSATTNVAALLGADQGFGTELGRKVLIMGDPGTGGNSISAQLNNGNGAFATVPPMQPVLSNGATVTLPSINFFLPAANVVTSGTNAVNVTKLPVPIAVGRTDMDSNNVPNVQVGLKGRAFDGSAALSAGVGNFIVKVGLFRSALDLKPMYIQTATVVSNTDTSADDATQVTFLDVADGTYIPMAWIDANSNGLLDDGESTIIADSAGTSLTANAARLTISKEDLFGTGAAGVVSPTSEVFDGSTTGLGSVFGENPNGMLGHSGDFYAFPARSISITLTTASAASVTLANQALECTDCSLRGVWGGGDGVDSTAAAAAVSLTIGNVAVPGIVFRMDHDDTAGETDNNLNDDDLVRLVVQGGDTGQIASLDGFQLVRYALVDADYARLTISPVPLATLVNIDAATAYGTYSVAGSVRALDPSDNNAYLGVADTFTLANGDVALGSGDHDVDTATVHFASKAISAGVGNGAVD